MRIAILGATGRTGRRVVDVALQRGHSVCAMARTAGQQPWADGVDAIAGSILQPDDVRAAIVGADAIIVTTSMVRTSDFPWARIQVPRDIYSRGVAVVRDVAADLGVRRHISLSAHGAGHSRSHAGRLFMGLVDASNIGVAYQDLERAERALQASALNWTVVRPTRLTNARSTHAWRAGTDLVCGNRASISRSDVALFMVHCAETGDFLRQCVTVDGV